jgi:hypothetical protein
MTSKKEAKKPIQGWLPKESYTVHSRESGNRKSSAPAYIVGYGVGIGICETLIILIDTLGWGTFESSLSPPLSLLSGMGVGIPATLLGVTAGAKLSKKLKERWVS